MTTVETYRVVPLGVNQRHVLKSLRDRGPYYKNGPWVWVNHSNTVGILASLERRGLVMVQGPVWHISEAGKATL